MPEVSAAATMKDLTFREVGIVLFALGISTIPSWPWVPSCPGLISWVATPRSAIQAVQLWLGEKFDVCILLRRDGQIQANDQDIVLATPVWVFLDKEIFTASLLVDIQVSYCALDREYLVSSSRVCVRRI